MSRTLIVPEPVGRFDRESGLWLPTERWVCPFPDGRRALEMLPGFLSDGASLPRILWSAVGPRFEARTFAAALFHDGAYGAELIARGEADRIFRAHLLMIGCDPAKARAYFLAVRALGWIAYNRHTTKSVATDRTFCRIIQFPESPIVLQEAA